MCPMLLVDMILDVALHILTVIYPLRLPETSQIPVFLGATICACENHITR
jgi:hypothetical protein